MLIHKPPKEYNRTTAQEIRDQLVQFRLFYVPIDQGLHNDVGFHFAEIRRVDMRALLNTWIDNEMGDQELLMGKSGLCLFVIPMQK